MGKKLEITDQLRKQYSNIDFDDFIYVVGNAKNYRGTCPSCGADRGYIAYKSRWPTLCRSCNGIKGGSNNMKGKVAHNKGKKTSLDQRIKQSCSHRKIDVKEFDDFLHKDRDRHEFNNSGLREQCFKSADYTCQICNARGVALNAHHVKPWKDYPEHRHDISNLQCLCESCHKDIHK